MSDYNEIVKSITEKFLNTGITCNAGQARLIDKGKAKAYYIEVTFVKGIQELKIPYRMGTGLFNKIDILEQTQRGDKQKRRLEHKVTQRYFKPAEILACACWEAACAIEMVVEDYCSEFYGHTDSYKGREAHTVCIRQYTLIANLIGREQLEEFANLHSQL